MEESLSPFTLFPVRAETPKSSQHSDFKMAHSFAIIGSIVATAFKFTNNVRM